MREEEAVEMPSMQKRERPTDEMSVRRVSDQVDGEAVGGVVEHPEGFAEAEVPHDVEGEVVRPVGDVLAFGTPSSIVILLLAFTVIDCASYPITESADVLEYVFLHPLHRRIGEGMAQHAPLSSVDLLVNRVVRVCRLRGRREDAVELGLADVGAKAVDCV